MTCSAPPSLMHEIRKTIFIFSPTISSIQQAFDRFPLPVEDGDNVRCKNNFFSMQPFLVAVTECPGERNNVSGSTIFQRCLQRYQSKESVVFSRRLPRSSFSSDSQFFLPHNVPARRERHSPVFYEGRRLTSAASTPGSAPECFRREPAGRCSRRQ